MAKKSRKVRLTEAQMIRPEVAQPVESVESQEATTDLTEEYQYVIADLKRIGVIALIMLTALIGLAMLLT
jgi:hypothetical protein